MRTCASEFCASAKSRQNVPQPCVRVDHARVGSLASDLAFSVSLSKSSLPPCPCTGNSPPEATLRHRSRPWSSQPPHALLFARRCSQMQGSRSTIALLIRLLLTSVYSSINKFVEKLSKTGGSVVLRYPIRMYKPKLNISST